MKSEIGDIARIEHILEAIEKIEGFIVEINPDNFQKDKLVSSACLYQLLIIGEACKHVSSETKIKYPDVKWNKAYGLRNKLAHEYDNIILSSIYKTVNLDFPIFKTQIKNILKELKKE